jgi:membrane protein implicated in regulation of membrane protease activity
MSALGGLTLALAALILLAALAGWLLNVPLWAVGVFVVVAGWVSSRLLKRFSRGRARQDTESPT